MICGPKDAAKGTEISCRSEALSTCNGGRKYMNINLAKNIFVIQISFSSLQWRDLRAFWSLKFSCYSKWDAFVMAGFAYNFISIKE